MLLHKFNWAIFKYSEIQIAKSATVEGEGACLVLGQRSLRGYSWQLRTTADIRLRIAPQKFGKAEYVSNTLSKMPKPAKEGRND